MKAQPSAPPVSEFVRLAVREKAERELARLDQQLLAFETIGAARAGLEALLEVLSKGTAPLAAIANGGPAIGRFKKLRRAVEEAHVLAGELTIELETEEGLTKLKATKARVLAELDAVGEPSEATASQAAE